MRTVRAPVPFEATTALRGRDDSVMAPPTVRSQRGMARGVGIHGAELQLCGAGVVDTRCSLLHRVRWSRAGRRATHGMRQTS